MLLVQGRCRSTPFKRGFGVHAIFCVDLVVGLVTSLMRHGLCVSAYCRDFGRNNVTGTIPTELGNLANLEHL